MEDSCSTTKCRDQVQMMTFLDDSITRDWALEAEVSIAPFRGAYTKQAMISGDIQNL